MLCLYCALFPLFVKKLAETLSFATQIVGDNKIAGLLCYKHIKTLAAYKVERVDLFIKDKHKRVCHLKSP